MTATMEPRAGAPVGSSAWVSVAPLTEMLAGDGHQAWERLRARARSTSPFTRWEWLAAWYATAPAVDREAARLVHGVDGTGELAIALPLASRGVTFRRVRATALTWAFGDVGCPDHLDVLASPCAPVDAVVAALETLDWDLLQLDGLAHDASGAPRLLAALRRHGYEASLRPQWVCPYADLPRSWDDYLATRGSARRKAIGYRERNLERHASVSVTMHDAATLTRGWSELLRLHDTRWSGRGAFDARLDALHRQFASALAQENKLWLATLEADGASVAAWYGFVDGDTLHFYQSGRADAWSKYSVGAVLHGAIMRHAIAMGLRRVDFLRGDEPYKAEWSTGSRMTYQLVAFRRNARGHMLRLADGAAVWREQRAQARDGRPAADDT